MPKLKGKRRWGIDEIVVLCGIYASSLFSVGDDEHEECKRIASEFGRSPGTVDRQWRNIKDYLAGKPCKKVGKDIKLWADVMLNDPRLIKRHASYICKQTKWELSDLLEGERSENYEN
jgi:hypothetical protein